MSRKQYTTLTLAVTVQVPQGCTQAETLQTVEGLLHQRLPARPEAGLNANAIVVKLLKKDITYL